MKLLDWLLRKPAADTAWQNSGFELMQLMPEFRCFADDWELGRLLKVFPEAVVAQGGVLDPGFSMPLTKREHRMWFALLVRFSVAGNREALHILADFAPTDSARLWALNPPSCQACGAVLPHHAEDRSDTVFVIDDEH
jgi:hypothetical protein